jgi:hypothetical protein
MEKLPWFGVRCVFRGSDGLYEERVTIWEADDFDHAIQLAEEEAIIYSGNTTLTFLGFAQAFRMTDPPQSGIEVFSLMRESKLEPDEYLSRFFDTGSEREEKG